MARVSFDGNGILTAWGANGNEIYKWTPGDFERLLDCTVVPSMYKTMCIYVSKNIKPICGYEYISTGVESEAVDYYYDFDPNVRETWHKCELNSLKEKADSIRAKADEAQVLFVNIIESHDRTDMREEVLDYLKARIDGYEDAYHSAMMDYHREIEYWTPFIPANPETLDEGDIARFLNDNEGGYDHYDEF
jgi:hypothetical protein